MARRPRFDPETITTIYEKRMSARIITRIKDRIDRESLRLITAINDDMRDRVGEVLKEGEDAGRSVAATASKLLTTGLDRGVFSSARKRAYLIAKTELHRARQLAAMDVYREAHIGLLRWIGIPDDGRICPVCRDHHGRVYRTADLANDELPPIHPRCRCRVVPNDFDIKITPKREHGHKVMETKITPTPKEYRYIVKTKVKKSLEKALPYEPQWGKTVVSNEEEIKRELLNDKASVAKRLGVKPEKLTYVGVQPTGKANTYFHMWNVDDPEHIQHMSSVVGIERQGLIKKSYELDVPAVRRKIEEYFANVAPKQFRKDWEKANPKEKKEVQVGYMVDMKKSRKNLVDLRKSKSKGKLIPQNINGKIRWTKAIGDDLWITTRTRKADVGDNVLVKGQIARVTAVGKDGITARLSTTDQKFQILHEDVKLLAKAIKDTK